jgi:hypothetical protein
VLIVAVPIYFLLSQKQSKVSFFYLIFVYNISNKSFIFAQQMPKSSDTVEFSLWIITPKRDNAEELFDFRSSPDCWDVIKSIEESVWYPDIIQYIVDVTKGTIDLSPVYKENVSFSVLLFYVFYYKEPLLIIQNKNTLKIDVYHIDAIGELFYENKYICLSMSNVLWTLRHIFLWKEEFKKLSEISKISIWEYSSMFEDIKAVQMIDEDFKNAEIIWKITNGKLKELEISTHTTKTDVPTWNKKLGNKNKKIEVFVNNDGRMTLKITKLHKYK